MAEFRPIRRARAGGPDLSGFEGVHLTLRAGLEELTAAVGAWRPGDAATAAVLHRLWHHFAKGLHHHHVGEDDLVWPALRAAAPGFAEQEERMRSEHADVDGHLGEADTAFAAFAERPDEASAERLRVTLGRLGASLEEHLRHEEDDVLPLINEHLAADAWRRIDTQLLRRLPFRDLAVAVGSIDDAIRRNPEALAAMPAPPLPVRALLAVAWRRRFARLVAPIRKAG
ncbi:MAG TPA: hemerythrin domain-containing protein [Acidimicrobiales bacterium]